MSKISVSAKDLTAWGNLALKNGNISSFVNLVTDWAQAAEEGYLELDKENKALQSKVDWLMLEYCPEEMSEEQRQNWEANQKVSDV